MLAQLHRDSDTRVTHSGRLTSAALTLASTPMPTPTNSGVESFVYAAEAGELTAGAIVVIEGASCVAIACGAAKRHSRRAIAVAIVASGARMRMVRSSCLPTVSG
jgi:hypothetical protein